MLKPGFAKKAESFHGIIFRTESVVHPWQDMTMDIRSEIHIRKFHI